jgi:uncharacterized protein (TIGR02757 family)
MNKDHIKEFLETKTKQYNTPEFIENDPISIPHQYKTQLDIEVAAFLTATISWGQRKAIIKSANLLMQMMDNAPYDFITNGTPQEFKALNKFVYRTFNGIDLAAFLGSLHKLYNKYNSLEEAFTPTMYSDADSYKAIMNFRTEFSSHFTHDRTNKHLANPSKGSSAKRINMFLRWMVRKDNNGVDFGIWNNLKPEQLIIPLDVHSASSARKLGLLDRKSNDWKAAKILTDTLKEFNDKDPVRYDYALFGLGVFEKF